jgi:transposase
MRKIKEVLRLSFELQLGQREIARACSISQGAVHNYLKKAAVAGIGWPLPEDWDEKRIEETLFGNRHPIERRQRTLPDFPSLHEQFQQHRHLTLQLVWEEYRQAHPEGYGYSRFCELYARWFRKQDVVLRQNHKPGEKGFVDWAGTTIPIQDPQTGEIRGATLFLMVLGASNYTYAEASLDQQMAAWLRCHIHAFEYFQAMPRLLVPDNTRTAVSRACRYDPDLNPTYQEMAMHYGIGVVPTRPYQPRDKACASYCTLFGIGSGEGWPDRPASAPSFDKRGTSERFIERIAMSIAIDSPQRTGPRPFMHGRLANS